MYGLERVGRRVQERRLGGKDGFFTAVAARQITCYKMPHSVSENVVLRPCTERRGSACTDPRWRDMLTPEEHRYSDIEGVVATITSDGTVSSLT
jgi:hypothetical protein